MPYWISCHEFISGVPIGVIIMKLSALVSYLSSVREGVVVTKLSSF